MAERTVLESIKGQRLLISAAPETSVREAACIMTRASCGSILVTDTSGGLVGIVTERDLMTRVIAKALDPASTTVAQVMTRNPHCVAPEMTVSAAVLVMIERGFRHLPILTKSNKIMGVFSVPNFMIR